MRIEHIALNVPDPVAMAEWYCRNLGMTIARHVGGPTFTHFLADDSGRTVLELYRQTKAPVPDYFAQDPMVLHIAFVSNDPEADRDRLIAAGAKNALDLVRAPNGDVLAMVHDPWGVAVQLVRRTERLIAS